MVSIDSNSNKKIFEQIRDQLIEYILMGFLEPNQQMQSVRTLAKELGINPNTVQKSYNELEKLGYIYSVQAKGSFVVDSKKLVEMHHQSKKNELNKSMKEALKIGIAKEEIIKMLEKLDKEDSND